MRILFDTVPETCLSLRLYPFDEDPACFVEVALLAYPAGGQTYWLPPQVRPCRMALRCRDVINVDPSVGMGQEFNRFAAEAGIDNASFVLADWLDVDGVEGWFHSRQ